MNFIEELKWRGLLQDVTPGAEEQLNKEMTLGYVGFDPTAESLHIGNLVPVMLLKHFQACGHRPVALVGGATGMVGDPSGKSAERNLLDEPTLRRNQAGVERQLRKFLDFSPEAPNAAVLVNNYDWMRQFSFLEFLRDYGKAITVSYMMTKDSVQNRLDTGISFTEFSYQLIQGYDFLHLYRSLDCRLQMGGSDQWGNITTGTEMVRRIDGGQVHACTAPLLTKPDGRKFGKSEGGNVWLSAEMTTPYKFYQFWLNVSDEEAERHIRIFTMLDRPTIEALVAEHRADPQARLLQRRLAEEVTVLVHSRQEYETAVEASAVLFGKGTAEGLRRLDEATLLAVCEGIPRHEAQGLAEGANVVDFLVEVGAFASKGELRRLIANGGLYLNQEPVQEAARALAGSELLHGKYLLGRKGKKNYFLISIS